MLSQVSGVAHVRSMEPQAMGFVRGAGQDLHGLMYTSWYPTTLTSAHVSTPQALERVSTQVSSILTWHDLVQDVFNLHTPFSCTSSHGAFRRFYPSDTSCMYILLSDLTYLLSSSCAFSSLLRRVSASE